uniref:Guanylate cyclase domain-containing protein n=2 Tax=Craspedostauros australis TaxID=1486917 RepID=A0A7R9WYN8_9STRA|mmetsp:Transcript_4375/g.11486  ORF Transcript_4375/g.11486 Transcript_4375/m.11486 type:complete len:197 (+) Transcript_4375:265-855(+)
MSLFAHECMRTMKLLLTKELRTLLGGDPSIISMRFGLHSGSVIAGVLRGEKSRFQLFGDTVNMAARIEHTGKRDRIHISPTTGELLIEAGKKKWLVERSDSPEDMQTYWLRPRSKTSAMDDARRSRASLSTDGGGTSISDAYSLSSGMSFGGMDGVSSHSRAWPEASTHSKAWIDSDSGDGFTMEGDMSDGGDSFA